MQIDTLSELPEWGNHEFDDDEEGERWKPNPTKEACKAMYSQWNMVMTMNWQLQLKAPKPVCLSSAWKMLPSSGKIGSSYSSLPTILPWMQEWIQNTGW